MSNTSWSMTVSRRLVPLMGVWLLACGFAVRAHAANYAHLDVVKPVVPCEQFVQAEVKTADGAKVTIRTAKVRATEKGPYCTVTASIAPNFNFQGNLPMEHWTQRFLMGGVGQQAGGCMPALNGEFAVAGGGGMGGGGGSRNTSDPLAATWGVTPQERINSAYLNSHMAAIGFKAVIKAFYGQSPKYSYMIGCSAPGLQVLMEAERFPEDFDGYSIGAPPLYQTNHDLGFFHGWEYHANQGPNGSVVLTKDKLPVLHAAAIQHCAAASGVIDGDLQQPSACKFDPSWVRCQADAGETSDCLTAEEAHVAEQLYLGPNDGKGHFFEVSGLPLGSEMNWRLSTTGKPADGEGQNPHGVHSFLMPPLSGQDTKTIMASFTFSQEWFNKTTEMQPLFNAANTDLRSLAKLGGKIILWQGAEDTTVQPANSLSYFQGVQKQLGAQETDTFLRYFLLPGVGHCGGGDSANQLDTLTPLMAWVETRKAPAVIVAGKPVTRAGTPGGGAPGGDGGPRPVDQAAGRPGEPGGLGPGPGGPGNGVPYPQPAGPTVYTRPIYPYPYVAKYKGTGDQRDAESYQAEKGPARDSQTFPNETARLLGPDNQKFYRVVDDRLEVVPKP